MSDPLPVAPRAALLLQTLNLSQPQLAGWLRVSQTTISRLVSGQEEPGPVSKLLDMLEQAVATLGLTAAREWVLSGTISAGTLADGLAGEALFETLKRCADREKADEAAAAPSTAAQASGFGRFE